MSKNTILPLQVSATIVALVLAEAKLDADYKAAKEAAHTELWATVHAEHPELNPDDDFKLACRYAEQGIVMLDESDKCGCDEEHPIAKLMQLVGNKT